MKITKLKLKQIIKEELQNVLEEQQTSVGSYGQKLRMPGDDLKFKIDPRLGAAGVPAQVDDSPRMQRRRRRERTPAQISIKAAEKKGYRRSAGLDDFLEKASPHAPRGYATAMATGNYLFLVPSGTHSNMYDNLLQMRMPILVTDGQAKENKRVYLKLNQGHEMNAIGLQTPSGKVVAVMLPPD